MLDFKQNRMQENGVFYNSKNPVKSNVLDQGLVFSLTIHNSDDLFLWYDLQKL